MFNDLQIQKKIQMITNQYTNRDFYLSAYLLAIGNELETYQKESGGLTTFVFRSTPELINHIHKFYAREALINPVEYGNALRNLKSMIHAEQITNKDKNYVGQYRTAK
jgi:hypothetical protein